MRYEHWGLYCTSPSFVTHRPLPSQLQLQRIPSVNTVSTHIQMCAASLPPLCPLARVIGRYLWGREGIGKVEKIGAPVSNRDRIYRNAVNRRRRHKPAPVGYVCTPFCWAAAHVSWLGIGGRIRQVNLALTKDKLASRWE